MITAPQKIICQAPAPERGLEGAHSHHTVEGVVASEASREPLPERGHGEASKDAEYTADGDSDHLKHSRSNSRQRRVPLLTSVHC